MDESINELCELQSYNLNDTISLLDELEDNDDDESFTSCESNNDTITNNIDFSHNLTSITLTGVVVNGFHPQLCKWKSHFPPKRGKSEASTERHIQDKVSRLRTDELKQLENSPNHMNIQHPKDVPTIIEDTNVLKLFSDVFENSKVPQLIAAPGGRIAAGELIL